MQDAIAIFFAYRAAYGTPGGSDPVSQAGPRPGLRNRVAAAKRAISEKSGERLRCAVIFTVLGVGATFAATALAWFPANGQADAGNPAICVVVDGKVILKVAGRVTPRDPGRCGPDGTSIARVLIGRSVSVVTPRHMRTCVYVWLIVDAVRDRKPGVVQRIARHRATNVGTARRVGRDAFLSRRCRCHDPPGGR